MYSRSTSLGITSEWFSNHRLLCGVLCSVGSRGGRRILGSSEWWWVDCVQKSGGVSAFGEVLLCVWLLESIDLLWMCGDTSTIWGGELLLCVCVSECEWGDLCVCPVCPAYFDESDWLLPLLLLGLLVRLCFGTGEESSGVTLFPFSRKEPTQMQIDKSFMCHHMNTWNRGWFIRDSSSPSHVVDEYYNIMCYHGSCDVGLYFSTSTNNLC